MARVAAIAGERGAASATGELRMGPALLDTLRRKKIRPCRSAGG
jgi:hypothetical protein